MLPEQIAVTVVVTDALEALRVRYAIGGSFASAVHGVMRATMDVDLVADLQAEQIDPLVERLGEAFYADAERRVYVTSAEDTVLAKLEWYRLGGEASGRQWRDALGVLRMQGDRLDHDYLQRMAAGLGIADLLSRALGEAT